MLCLDYCFTYPFIRSHIQITLTFVPMMNTFTSNWLVFLVEKNMQFEFASIYTISIALSNDELLCWELKKKKQNTTILNNFHIKNFLEWVQNKQSINICEFKLGSTLCIFSMLSRFVAFHFSFIICSGRKKWAGTISTLQWIE